MRNATAHLLTYQIMQDASVSLVRLQSNKLRTFKGGKELQAMRALLAMAKRLTIQAKTQVELSSTVTI